MVWIEKRNLCRYLQQIAERIDRTGMARNTSKQDNKQERLSAMLRGNLQKRKAQMRARRNAAEQVSDGIPEDISDQRAEKLQKDE